MIYTSGFLLGLLVTVLVMIRTIQSGIASDRRAHLRRALATVVSLAVTVLFAYLMSAHERLMPEREMDIHRIFSRAITWTVPFVAGTGALLWRYPGWRWPHRICVVVLLLATLGAAVTGVWALCVSSPRLA